MTAVVDPGVLPGAAVTLFVGVAGQQGDQRDQVEAAEHADADHELLQLLLVAFIVLDDLPDVVERDDARQDEEEADYDAYTQRGQNKVAQGVQVVEPHKTNSADVVPFNLVHSQQHDSQRPGDPPGSRVEPHLKTRTHGSIFSTASTIFMTAKALFIFYISLLYSLEICC